VIFAIEDDQVRLLPATFTLESAAGSVQPLGRTVEAKEEKAERERGTRRSSSIPTSSSAT